MASLKQTAEFFEDLSEYLNSGIPLLTALDFMPHQMAKAIQYGLKRGDRLSTVLAAQQVYQPLLSVLAAAELTGQEIPVINSIAYYCVQLRNVQKELQGQLIYPAIIIFFSIILVLIYFFFILPVLKPLLPEQHSEFPWPWFSGFVSLILIGIAQRVKIGQWLLEHTALIRQGFWLQFFLLLQLFHVVKNYALFESIAGQMIFPERMHRFSYALKRGESLDQALRYAQAPELYCLLIQRGIVCQQLDQTLRTCVAHSGQIFADSLRTLKTCIEPLLTVVMGLVVGILAYNFFMPLMKIMQISDGI